MPKSRGRPKTKKSEKQNNPIIIYFNDKEFEKIISLAKSLGIGHGSYLKLKLREHGII